LILDNIIRGSVAFLVLGIVMMLFNMNLMQKNDLYFYPKYLYKTTNMNMFGCIMCSIVLFIANYLYCTIACIIHLIYWISHVGRKKEDIKCVFYHA
jgi:hypothetical protein